MGTLARWWAGVFAALAAFCVSLLWSSGTAEAVDPSDQQRAMARRQTQRLLLVSAERRRSPPAPGKWLGSAFLRLEAVEFMFGVLLEILSNTKQHVSRYGIVRLRGHDPHPLGSLDPVLRSIDKGNRGHGGVSLLGGGT
jgi:hypothetical protein